MDGASESKPGTATRCEGTCRSPFLEEPRSLFEDPMVVWKFRKACRRLRPALVDRKTLLFASIEHRAIEIDDSMTQPRSSQFMQRAPLRQSVKRRNRRQ
jgi:hypothetical protein